MKTWSFASQSNNDQLLSSVPAVLALLLRISSSIPELEHLGLRLGRTLLQKRQLELIARGLTANKAKEFVISPALRLLQQLVTFDGGSLAKQVFKAKDNTLKGLTRNLGLRYTGEGIEERKKPSVRTNALRFFVACVKFLPAEEKRELLIQRDVTAGVTRDISADPPYLLVELLENLKTYVLQDKSLAREAKSRFLNAVNLGRLVTLYGYDQPDYELPEGKKSVDVLAHEFILLACTDPNFGVLRRQAGFYPRGMDPDFCPDVEGPQDFIDLGLESLEWASRFADNVPVRNSVLSEFIQTLRPWSNTKQSELLMKIFKAAPELVADYYFNKKSFTFEPKLTATWIGYAAVLFSTAQLPLPPYFGHQESRYGLVPPPTSVVIESILPRPVTQKALNRCLFNQKSPLITFFAVRLLVVAFEKLRDVLAWYHEASAPIWDQAAKLLVEEFSQRCPSMLDAINAFKAIPETEIMQRQAASKLLVMFYEIVPQIALEAKFDVSTPLTDALKRLLEEPHRETEEAVMRAMDVENLFQIARCSPGMRWFNKVDSFDHSPFTAMLRLSVEASAKSPLRTIRSILDSVIQESGIMQTRTKLPGLDALITALRAQKYTKSVEIYTFLDSCALRCASTPVKYIDSADQYYESAHAGVDKLARHPLSLLLLVIAEQWPFVVKSSEPDTLQEIAEFLSSYLAASIKLGEDKKILKLLIKHLGAESPDGSRARKIIEKTKKIIDTIELPEVDAQDHVAAIRIPGGKLQNAPTIATTVFDFVENSREDPDDHRALTRWRNKEMAEVIEDGHAASLISLLSNLHLSARKEALTNIAKLSADIKQSDYEFKEQIWWLLMEVHNTATKSDIDTTPLPTPLTAFAVHALSVLQQPGHVLYPKVNMFIGAGPTWDVGKIPLVKDILNDVPYKDGSWDVETAWLLKFLASALRTPADMDIFHKRRTFEQLLNLYNDAYITKDSKEAILQIVARATTLEGGSDTLITRFAILSWLKAEIHSEVDKDILAVLRVLLEKILETCDEEKIEAWSGCKLEDHSVDA